MNRIRFVPPTAALACLLCAGCLLDTSARKAYLTEYEGGAVRAVEASGARPVLRVGTVVAAEPYGSTRMLVHDAATGRLHGTLDARLATPPAVAVRNGVRRALAESGAFASVEDGALTVPGAQTLQGFVEHARLERRADGSFAYAISATFRLSGGGAAERSFAVRVEAPAEGDGAEQQAAAARAAAAKLAVRVVAELTR